MDAPTRLLPNLRIVRERLPGHTVASVAIQDGVVWLIVDACKPNPWATAQDLLVEVLSTAAEDLGRLTGLTILTRLFLL